MRRKIASEKKLGVTSGKTHHRFESHKALNLLLSLDKTNKEKNQLKADKSFSLYKTKQISNKENDKLRQKSNIKKDYKKNDENSNGKHVRFGTSLSKVIVSKNKLNQNEDHTLKKTHSNFDLKLHNIFNFEESESSQNIRKTLDKTMDNKDKEKLLLKTDQKYQSSKSNFKKALFSNNYEEDNNNNNNNNNNSNRNLIKIERKGGRKRTVDYGCRNASRIKINKLDLEIPSVTYVKSNKATSAAGKDSGRSKTNQDSYINENNINGISGFGIFGVLDGHGINGHFSSQFVKKYILNKIKNLPVVRNLAKPKDIYQYLVGNNYRVIANIFIDADDAIKRQNFNCENSGTTCVIVFQLDEHLICANAGDSRAILIYDDKNDERLRSTKIYPLSFDCKPQNPSERKRIIDKGGEVKQDVDEDGNPEGTFRVWVKGENWPGIAISRSIGDSDAKKIGVIPNPQIIEYTLNPKSKYMIICSDGIWEYISNEEAMNIANNYYLQNNPLGLCKDLTRTSTDIWNSEDLDGDVDDITVVVVFF